MYHAIYKCGDCGSIYNYEEYERLRWICDKCRSVIKSSYIDEKLHYYIDKNRFNNIDNILENKRIELHNREEGIDEKK